MRTGTGEGGKLGTWLMRGMYPRLYVPIVLIIVLASVVRYHYLLDTETGEARQQAAAEMRRASDQLLPLLAAQPPTHSQETLQAALGRMRPAVQALRWQVGSGPAVLVQDAPATPAAPRWVVQWLDIAAPQQQFGQATAGGATGHLTVTLQAAPSIDRVWDSVVVQMRISALNIFTILFLLTLLLRANARMLRRLATATNAFRQGHLDTRMAVAGTLESRALATTFNDMAGKVQSLVLSLRETQRLQSEQLHFTRQLIDALPLPVFVRGTDGTTLEANRAWRRLFPGPADCPAELLQGRSAQVAHAQDNEIHLPPARHRPPLCLAYYEAAFTHTSGALAGTIGTLVDVTERQRAQDALRAEKERAEVTLASIGDGVITTDLDGRIDGLNEAAQLMTGFTAEQALGRPLDEVFRLVEEPTGGRAVAATPPMHPTGLQPATQQVLIHRCGERYAVEYTASAIRQANGRAMGCVLVFRDVTEARALRHQLSWHARHDPLTGLYNRAALAERLTHALYVARSTGRLLAVCLLDLDHFQAINDAQGTHLGDRLLKETARRLAAFATEADAVARLGGDEFVLLLGEQADVDAVRTRVAALMQQLAADCAIDDQVLRTTVSVGVAVLPQDDANPDQLLRRADQAMCQAKRLGRNRMHLFDLQHDHAVQTQHTRQARVAQALQGGELVLHYQPKVNLRTGAILGLEALLRWQHPTHGLLGPHHVLPLVEDPDLVVALGEWVLRAALGQMRHWAGAGMAWEISVNIAAPHFHRPDFVQRLQDILHECPEVPARRLELEILESAALQDMEAMRRMMQGCQALGVRFALDDFGTGFSSLSYLKRLPAETVKIDQSFVHGLLDEDGDDLTLVNAIVGLARAFGRQVVAEGVETTGQCARLLELGCEHAQGFGIARPMPAHEVLGWARRFAEGTAGAVAAPPA